MIVDDLCFGQQLLELCCDCELTDTWKAIDIDEGLDHGHDVGSAIRICDNLDITRKIDILYLHSYWP